MTATLADLTRLDAILRDRPLVEELQDAFNKSTVMAEKVVQQLDISGRQGIFPVSAGVNEGIYARAEKGTFGNSQVDQPSLATVTVKYVYATFDITGPSMSATKDQWSFEDALALELEKTVDGIRLDMARMILNKSLGMIGVVDSRTSATVAVVKNPYGLTYKADRPIRNILRKNQPIELDTTATGSVQATGALTSVVQNASNTTITLDTAESGTIAATNEVFRSGNRGNEIQGFFTGTQNSGTYLNISRTGFDGWQGVVVDATGGGSTPVALDPDMLRDQIDSIMEISGKTPDYLVSNFKQRRNIYNLLAPQIRYMPMVLPGGLNERTLSWDDIPVIVERFFPPEHIGFLNSQTWYHAINKDVEWIRGLDGSVLHFGAATSDVFRAVARTYRDFVCFFPAANGYLYGLSE